MSADIEPIRDGPKSWGAKAAAGDALNRVPNTAPFIGMWIEKDAQGNEVLKYSKANTDYLVYSFIAIALMEFAQSCVRLALERHGGPPPAA